MSFRSRWPASCCATERMAVRSWLASCRNLCWNAYRFTSVRIGSSFCRSFRKPRRGRCNGSSCGMRSPKATDQSEGLEAFALGLLQKPNHQEGQENGGNQAKISMSEDLFADARLQIGQVQ